jgi:hypothetical protein
MDIGLLADLLLAVRELREKKFPKPKAYVVLLALASIYHLLERLEKHVLLSPEYSPKNPPRLVRRLC